LPVYDREKIAKGENPISSLWQSLPAGRQGRWEGFYKIVREPLRGLPIRAASPACR